MITLLHLSDIHMGSGFVHGRLNPETGLNTRLEDFIAALTRCMQTQTDRRCVRQPDSPDCVSNNHSHRRINEIVTS